MNLAAELPTLLPHAIAWVKYEEGVILSTGRLLTANEMSLAQVVGVQAPARVRIKVTTQLPQPTNPRLQAAADQTGLLGPSVAGITFGHGIYILEVHLTNRLISHELRHVYQYETAASIASFLTSYLEQIVTVGYDRAPHELDARRHERET